MGHPVALLNYIQFHFKSRPRSGQKDTEASIDRRGHWLKTDL